jgi:hypothetical protein
MKSELSPHHLHITQSPCTNTIRTNARTQNKHIKTHQIARGRLVPHPHHPQHPQPPAAAQPARHLERIRRQPGPAPHRAAAAAPQREPQERLGRRDEARGAGDRQECGCAGGGGLVRGEALAVEVVQKEAGGLLGAGEALGGPGGEQGAAAARGVNLVVVGR